MTSTTSAERVVMASGRAGEQASPRMAALLLSRVDRQRGGDDRLGRFDVGDGRDADAGGLDDVDDVDADAGPDVARRRGVIPRHVDRDDGGDDAAIARADAAALSGAHSAEKGSASTG